MLDAGYSLYQAGRLFHSGSIVKFSTPFQGSLIQIIDKKKKRTLKQEFPATSYILKTIQTKNGDVELTNSNGELIGTNIKHLIPAGFKVAEDDENTQIVAPVTAEE